MRKKNDLECNDVVGRNLERLDRFIRYYVGLEMRTLVRYSKAATAISVFFVLTFLFATEQAIAQISIEIPNADFETGGPADGSSGFPDEWEYLSGSNQMRTYSDGGGAQGRYICQVGSPWPTYGSITVNTNVIDLPSVNAGDPFEFPFSVGGTGNSVGAAVQFYDDGGVAIDRITNYPLDKSDSEWQRDTLTVPALTGVVPANAQSFRVEYQTNGYSCVDDMGPITFPTATPEAGTGSELSAAEILALAGIEGSMSDILNEINNFNCGDVSSVVGSFTSSVGGGLFGILSAILNINLTQLKALQESFIANCQAAQANVTQAGILQAVGVPQTNAAIVIDPTASDPLSDDLAVIMGQSIGAYQVGNDDLVTAQNKTNRLLVASAMANAEAYDRMTGGKREPYESERGAKITAADIATQEPNLEFAEGDYGQTKGRLDELSGGIEPLYEDNAELTPYADEYTGSCLVDADPVDPSATGWENAMNRIKWNARQQLAGSNAGEFICGIIDQEERVVTEMCFGPPEGISINYYANKTLQLVPVNGMCVYGPQAPSFMNSLFDAMPAIMLLFSGFAVVRMFV